MKSFEVKIGDPLGIHARPAGLLVREASAFQSDITLEKNSKKGDAKKIFAVMGLGVKGGDVIKITVNGRDEEKATVKLKEFFEKNL